MTSHRTCIFPVAISWLLTLPPGCGLEPAACGSEPAILAAAPTIESVTPTAVPCGGGTSLSITGTNFRRNVRVLVGARPATSVVRHSESRITATTPACGTRFGTSDISVRNSDRTESTLAAAIRYYAENLSFSYSLPIYGGPAPFQLAGGDFNRDGHLDLATVGFFSSQIQLIYGKPDGSYAPLAPGTGPDIGGAGSAVAAADVNGDNKLDLVAVTPDGGKLALVLGRDTGFERPHYFDIAGGPIALSAADLDGDGKADVAVVSQATSQVSIFWGTSTGLSDTPATLTVGHGPTSIIAADVDGDRKADLVVANTDEHTVGLLRNLGTRRFAAMTQTGVGNQPIALASGDLEGDGAAEVLVAAAGSNEIFALASDPSTGLRILSSWTTAKRPTGLAVGDLNADGIPDVVVSYFEDTYVELYRGESGGRFTPLPRIPIGLGPFGIWITPAANGELPDVAVANSRGGVVVVLKNQSR